VPKRVNVIPDLPKAIVRRILRKMMAVQGGDLSTTADESVM